MDKFKRQQIRAILQDDKFHSVELLKDIVIQEISRYEIKADDEFNTIWRTAKREAGVEVLEDFFKRMVLEASKSDD